MLRLTRGFIKTLIPNLYQAALQVPAIRDFLQKAKHGNEFGNVIKGKTFSNQDKANIVKQFGSNLQIFIDICKAKGITPVLMTMFSRITDNPDKLVLNAVKQLRVDLDYQAFKDLFDNFNETIRRKAHENGVMVIDLARHIPQDSDHMYDITHLTGNGCGKAAEIISSDLSPLLSLKN